MERHQLKILSIDGGGIKGIIPCVILKAIADRAGTPIHKLFHLVAGTSTGGIVALGLCKPQPFTPTQMLELYQQEGNSIFKARRTDWISKIASWLGKDLEAATQQAYDQAGIENALSQRFGYSKLADTLTQVLVTTYDTDKGEPFYFSSRLARKNPAAEDFLLKQVARSTSAAPTYFEPNIIRHTQHKDMVTVDGGVFANNPAVLAYAEAKELYKQKNELVIPGIPTQDDAKGYTAQVTPDDLDLPFFMLSLGCGFAPTTVKAADAANWKSVQWFKPLMTDIFMRSVSNSIEYTMEHLLPAYTDGVPRYLRYNPPIPDACREMDDASPENIKRLINVGETWVSENSKAIDNIVQHIA